MKTMQGEKVFKAAVRRGSFLVLVVGMLALLAVIAIIYVSIGSSDLRTRSALARQDRLDEVPRAAADYIAGIIGRDALAVRFDYSGAEGRDPLNANALLLTRDNTDYPSVSILARSDVAVASPTEIPFDPVGGYDPIIGNSLPETWPTSNPFLSASEASFVFDNSANAYEGLSAPEFYRLRKDWASITNIAPDGRFINLFNLRDNFNAEPGTGVDANGKPRLSEYLTLLNANGSPSSNTDWGASLDPDIPAHFTIRQRHAFRPMNSWPAAFGVDDAAYPPYQWADTDGDGMFDARWFVPVDSRDAMFRHVFGESDSKYRFVYAARIVDLSARVNVNTATDQRIAPNAPGPMGFSPADVDLRRLLSGYDAYEAYQGSPLGLGFAGIPQPPVATRIDNYSAILAPAQFNMGTWGYESLRMAHAGGSVPPASLLPGAQLPAGYQNFIAPVVLNAADWNFKTGEPRLRSNYYERRANAMLGAYPINGGGYDSRAGFDLDSLAELLTFNGANNPSVTSALEATLGGRGDPGADPIRQFSPMRDNRASDVELYRIDAGSQAVRPDAMHLLAIDPRQRLTTLSGSTPRRDVRGVSTDVLSTNELQRNARAMLEAQLAPAANQEPLRDLFRAYADALLPFSDVANAWTGLPQTNTLFYGHRGPILAAMTAAHMAANMADSYDENTTPTVSTLLFNVDRAGDLNTDMGQPPATQMYPGWASGNGLYLTDRRSARTADGLAINAINVYGIEAQPFITGVATYTAYADVPGASDFEGSGQEIEINGTLDLASNKDFLYRAVMFQITNPFGRDVVLSQDNWPVDGGVFQNADQYDQGDANVPEADRERNYYYLRWAGRSYKLASLREQTYLDTTTAQNLLNAGLPAVADDTRIGQYFTSPAGGGLDITASGITIPAGQTIICYALTESPQRILARLRDVDPTLVAGGVGSLRSSVIQVIQNDMRADSAAGIAGIYWIGAIDDATGRYDFSLTPNELAGTVLLPPSSAPTVEVWRSVRTTQELQSQPFAPPGTFWDGVTSSSAATLQFYPRNVRENDQLMDRFRIPAGVDFNRKLPDGDNKVQGTDADRDNDGYALMLWAAARRPSDPALAGQLPRGAFPGYCIEPKYNANWNVADPGNSYGSDLDDSWFSGNPAAERTVEQWRRSVGGTPMVQEMKVSPARTTSPRMTAPPRANPADADTLNYQDYYPEFVIDNAKFLRDLSGTMVSTLRPADLLLPMGIGPWSNLLMDPVAQPNARWTTLGEALAASMGYEGYLTSPADAGDLSVLLRPDATIPSRKVFDRGGNLRLDDYVPFLDRNTNGLFETSGGTPDIRMGEGIPAALSVLSQFYVSPVAQRSPSLTRLEPGRININTAPVEVARLLPMLSPPPPTNPLGAGWWWWAGPGALDQRADVAATLVAYRDKNDAPLRPQAATATGFGVVSYFDSEQYLNIPNTKSRQTFARIPALREETGFSSVGEVMALRNIPNPAQPGDYELPWSIDQLGYDGRAAGAPVNNSRVGLDSVLYTNAGAPVTDELRNEYKEKLTIANAVLPSVTTRSDVFAVWFVVHGYQKSDVETGLNGPAGARPMVPSIARRFVMVVDRSNVTQKGQKPNVLLFREVPY